MGNENIQINIELGKEGLYYVTSPQINGLLIAAKSVAECIEELPDAYYRLMLCYKHYNGN